MGSVRPATREDGPFLAEMLALAADWRPGTMVRSVAEVMAVPALAHSVAGWGRPGDAGFVATDGVAVGAAWWRYLAEDDPGYGFVDARIPEVTVAVVPGARGRGHGAALLGALLAEARARGIAALSLSVEIDNPAAALYRRLGFQALSSAHGATTMRAVLDGPRPAPRREEPPPLGTAAVGAPGRVRRGRWTPDDVSLRARSGGLSQWPTARASSSGRPAWRRGPGGACSSPWAS
jgi:ribosomal protein S18 acetylase RimI-like enzyme